MDLVCDERRGPLYRRTTNVRGKTQREKPMCRMQRRVLAILCAPKGDWERAWNVRRATRTCLRWASAKVYRRACRLLRTYNLREADGHEAPLVANPVCTTADAPAPVAVQMQPCRGGSLSLSLSRSKARGESLVREAKGGKAWNTPYPVNLTQSEGRRVPKRPRAT